MKKYEECILLEKNADGSYSLSTQFQQELLNKDFKEMVLELLDFGIEQWKEKYKEIYKDTNFTLYQKHTYEEVCRLLDWNKNLNAQNIGGYYYDSDTKTLPVFINYHKSEDAIAYEDRFVSESYLIALSKHPRKITSSDAVHIYKFISSPKRIRIIGFFCLSEKTRMIMKQRNFIFWERSLQREVRDRFTWKKQKIMPLR